LPEGEGCAPTSPPPHISPEKMDSRLMLLPVLNAGAESILSLAFSHGVVYAGTEGGSLLAFELQTLRAGKKRRGRTRPVSSAPARSRSSRASSAASNSSSSSSSSASSSCPSCNPLACDPICHVRRLPSSRVLKPGVEVAQLQALGPARVVLALCGSKLHLLRERTLEVLTKCGKIKLPAATSVFDAWCFRPAVEGRHLRLNLCTAWKNSRRIHIFEIDVLHSSGADAVELRSAGGCDTGRELFVPAMPRSMKWISAEEICLGFEREYTVINLEKDKVSRLCSVDTGVPVVTRLLSSRRGLLCCKGTEVACFTNPRKIEFTFLFKDSSPYAIEVSKTHLVSLHRSKLIVHGIPQRASQNQTGGREDSGTFPQKPATDDQKMKPTLHRIASTTEDFQWQWLDANTQTGQSQWVSFESAANRVIEMAYRKEYKECMIHSSKVDSSSQKRSIAMERVTKVDIARKKVYIGGKRDGGNVGNRIRRLLFSPLPKQTIFFSAQAMCSTGTDSTSLLVSRRGQIYSLVSIPVHIFNEDRKVIRRVEKSSHTSDTVGDDYKNPVVEGLYQSKSLLKHIRNVLSNDAHPLGCMMTRFSLSILSRYEDAHYTDQEYWREQRETLRQSILTTTKEVKGFMARMVTTISVLYNLNKTLGEPVSSCVERTLFKSVYDQMIVLFRTFNYDSDQNFYQACLGLKDLPLHKFGCNLFGEGDGERAGDPSASDSVGIFEGKNGPISLMPEVVRQKDVTSKLRLLDMLHKRLISCAEAEYSKQYPQKTLCISADDLMPMFCFIIVRSNTAHLFSETHLLTEFLSSDAQMGHLGFLVTSLQIGLHYILKLSSEYQACGNIQSPVLDNSPPKKGPNHSEGPSPSSSAADAAESKNSAARSENIDEKDPNRKVRVSNRSTARELHIISAGGMLGNDDDVSTPTQQKGKGSFPKKSSAKENAKSLSGNKQSGRFDALRAPIALLGTRMLTDLSKVKINENYFA